MRRRLSASHALIALAVVLAFVLNILALQDRSASALVAVADRPIPAGSVLADGMVRLVPVPADFAGLAMLLTGDALGAHYGQVLKRAIPEGGLIDLVSLVEPGSPSGKRAMSIPVSESRAAGGSIVAGDTVDVIGLRDGAAVWVVTGVEVVAVPTTQRGLGVAEYHLVVAVDADQALALAQAMESGKIDVVRSTGAPSVGATSDAGSP